MSKKRSQNRSRRASKQNQQNRNLMTIFFVVAIVGVIGLIIASGGLPGDAAGPDVEQSRLDVDPVLGAVDAPVTIIEYSAYSCHACRSWHQARIVENILNEFTGQVNFIQRDFPVISPDYDMMTANIAQCALDQDEHLFWALHDGLYTQVDLGASEEDVLSLGERIGLNYDELKSCADNNSHIQTVSYDRQRAYDLGLRGTPAFLVNGQRLFSPSPEALRAAVVSALNS